MLHVRVYVCIYVYLVLASDCINIFFWVLLNSVNSVIMLFVRRMVHSRYEKQQASSMAARRYARYRHGHSAVLKGSTARVITDNPLLHVECGEDYCCTSSGYPVYTPTKDKQVFQSFFMNS